MSITARRNRPWVDPRLVIGVLLVAGSTAGVAWLVASADRTVDMYAAPALLLPGDRVVDADLQVVPVRLGAQAEGYLPVGSIPEDGVVVTRVVGAGELLPASAIGAGAEGAATVVVPLRTPLPASLTDGAAVQVWAAVDGAEAVLLADDAVLAGAAATEGMFVGDAGSVEVQVPREAVPALLAAVEQDAAITVVGAN